MRLSTLVGLGAMQLAAVAGPSFAYQIIDLGNLGEYPTFAAGLSNNLHVTGNSTITQSAATAEGATGSRLRAYRWQNGSMQYLGSLPNATTNRFSRGFGVNDAGVVVGEFNNDAPRAFVHDPLVGTMVGLPSLAGGDDRGVAEDINNAGVIVGISNAGSVSRATRWTPSGGGYVPTDLGSIDGTTNFSSRANAINELGAIVGMSRDAGAATSQATLWNGGSIVDLNSLGDGNRFSTARGINDSNVVVGESYTGQTVGQLIGSTSSTSIIRGFVWQNGTMTELPPFNLYAPGNTGSTTNYHSYASDVNSAGVIVGRSERIQGLAAVATMWTLADTTPVDLNSLIPPGSGWILRSAENINDAGHIVGYGTFAGETHGFLLIVPEPASLASVMLAGSLLLRRHRRDRRELAPVPANDRR